MSMVTQPVTAGPDVAAARKSYAERIKALMVNWTANTLALAKELSEAAETFPVNPKRPHERPGFATWAIQTTGISRAHIATLLQIHQKFGDRGQKHQLAGQVMRMLSVKGVPESARQEIVHRSERGEHIGLGETKKIIRVHQHPTAKDANKLAKEEGRPVLARDGYIYFGTDPGRAKEGEDRRTMVYGVRKALDTLGSINLTATQFLDYALPHQLWDAEEAKVIKKALRWLTALDAAWDNRE